jgi:hypothetical protein
MASFTAGYAYELSSLGNNQYTIDDGNIITTVASDGDSGGSFELEEVITGQGLPDDGLTYLGSHLDGWIGVTQDGNTIYFLSNETLPTSSTPFTASTEPFTPPCFLAGTLITTPDGGRPVEALTIGDPVLTADGRTVPVRWVGRRTIVTAFGPRREHAPVEIAEGAFGPALPARPLRLTADHALLLDGLLVQAGVLVDGHTARRMTATDLGERYTVFHVETEKHDLILAEGVPAETFLDNVTRRTFDNVAEFEALYGNAAPAIDEMEVPRVKSARQLPRALRERLSARSAGSDGAVAAAA